MPKLLSVSNSKLLKGGASHLSAMVPMVPDSRTCPNAGKADCLSTCLYLSGMAIGYKSINISREAKRERFFNDRKAFMADLVKDVEALLRKAARENVIPCVRLNGFSDINYANIKAVRDGVTHKNIFEAFRTVQFYDYSKVIQIMKDSKSIPNLHITFSYSPSEDFEPVVKEAKRLKGFNWAVVFENELPKTWQGKTVINGELSDLRFLDEKNVIVGLVAKGTKNAKYNNTLTKH